MEVVFLHRPEICLSPTSSTEGKKHLTDFEANGNLWNFSRVPFRVTHGVPVFQKAINIVNGLEGNVVDIGDVGIGGATELKHEKNSKNSDYEP